MSVADVGTPPRPRGWSLLAQLVGGLTFKTLERLGVIIGLMAFHLLRIRRQHVEDAMLRAGIHPRHARNVYVSLGKGVFELLWVAGRRLRGGSSEIASSVIIEDWRRFESARALGNGVVVATAHTGNWDLAACACGERTALTIVTKRLRASGLDAFWQGTRRDEGIELVDGGASGALGVVLRRLSAGGAVALLVDQVPDRQHGVVRADFLGAEAFHDMLPATVAARSGAPIVVAFARRRTGAENPRDVHSIEIVDVIFPPVRPRRDWIEATTRKIASQLEVFIREQPSDWLWLHRRWRRLGRRGDQAHLQ